MSWIDLAILGVIALSSVISIIRGFVKESISLVTWVVASIVAFRYFMPLADLLEPFVNSLTLRQWISGGILFIATLIVGAIVNFIVSQLVSKTGLSGTDKVLGVVFGAARGVLIVSMLILVANLTPMPGTQWWQDSALIGFFQQLADWIRAVIPHDLGAEFSFN